MKTKTFGLFIFVVLLISALVAVADKSVRESHTFDRLLSKLFVLPPQAASCVDNALFSNPGSYTISTPTRAQYQLTNADTDGCNLYLGETGVADGQVLEIINVGAQAIALPESSGVIEGSGTSTLGQYDAVSLRYIGDRWIQLSPESDN